MSHVPVILAAAAAAVIADLKRSSGGDNGNGPKHSPGFKNDGLRIRNQETEAQAKAQSKSKKGDAEIALEGEERQIQDVEEYAVPEFLLEASGSFKQFRNWAIVCESGSGKSSLAKSLTQNSFAATAASETTSETTLLDFGDVRCHVLPGSRTANLPHDSYVKAMGLRYFDLVFLVSDGRFKKHKQLLYQELKTHKVPVFAVWTKVNQDRTKEVLQEDTEQNGFDPNRTYFLSVQKKLSFPGLSDTSKMMEDILSEQAKALGHSQPLGTSAGNSSFSKPVGSRSFATVPEGRAFKMQNVSGLPGPALSYCRPASQMSALMGRMFLKALRSR